MRPRKPFFLRSYHLFELGEDLFNIHSVQHTGNHYVKVISLLFFKVDTATAWKKLKMVCLVSDRFIDCRH